MSISRKAKSKKYFAHRSSFHRFIEPNLSKISLYSQLYSEIVRYHNLVFDLKFSELKFDGSDRPSKMIKYSEILTQTKLTGSFKQAICIQIADELSGLIKNFNYWLKRSLTDKSEKTLKKLETVKTKPEFSNFELRFCFADLQINSNLSYLQINGCGEFGIKHEVYREKKINKRGIEQDIVRNANVLRLPFKFPKYHKSLLSSGWSISTSVTLCQSGFRINYERETIKNESTTILGCDQGIKNCLSLASSDGSVFQSKESDIHGHSLSSIQAKLCRKKKGSKAYRRAQEHRKNFINARIKEAVPFIKQAGTLNLEDLRRCGQGSNKGSFLSKFEHSRIRFKLGQICNEQGLQFNLSANAFKSRRCSQCGWVDKANRVGKIFKCAKCGFEDDADLNAAKNHLIENLPKLSLGAGNEFYWQMSGANLVPDARKI